MLENNPVGRNINLREIIINNKLEKLPFTTAKRMANKHKARDMSLGDTVQ